MRPTAYRLLQLHVLAATARAVAVSLWKFPVDGDIARQVYSRQGKLSAGTPSPHLSSAYPVTRDSPDQACSRLLGCRLPHRL